VRTVTVPAGVSTTTLSPGTGVAAAGLSPRPAGGVGVAVGLAGGVGVAVGFARGVGVAVGRALSALCTGDSPLRPGASVLLPEL
jgi:hypothetical protein